MNQVQKVSDLSAKKPHTYPHDGKIGRYYRNAEERRVESEHSPVAEQRPAASAHLSVSGPQSDTGSKRASRIHPSGGKEAILKDYVTPASYP